MGPLSATLMGLAAGFTRRREKRAGAASVETCLDAFETCLLAIDGDQVQLISGRESLETFAADLGQGPGDAAAFVRMGCA